MKTFEQYTQVSTLLEKVTAKDFKEAEGDTRIQIGIEYEVEDCQMRAGPFSGYDTDEMTEDVNNWIQGVVDYSKELYDTKQAWKEEIKEAVEREVETIQGQIDEYQENIDGADEEKDANKIEEWESEIADLEEKMSDLQNLSPEDQADELGYGYWADDIDYPYIDTGSWGEWLADTGVDRNFPDKLTIMDFVLDQGDYGDKIVDYSDVYDLLFGVPHYFDDYYDTGDFEDSINQDSSAWEDLVVVIGEQPKVESDGSGDGISWVVTDDGSLSDEGVEIISPILKLKDGMKNIDDMFKWIEKYGKTDSSTGLHINMSFEGYDMEKFDWLKLLMFVEEGAIYKDFANRKDDRYAASILSYFSQLNGNWDRLSTDEYFKQIKTGDMEGMKKVRDLISGGKFFGVNFTKGNRIEFRYMGGRYSNRAKQVKEIILRYAAWMRIALDPTFKKTEYIKKVIKLVNQTGDRVASSTVWREGDMLMTSNGFSGDSQLGYILSKDKRLIHVFDRGQSNKMVNTMKPREAIMDFRFRYAALLQGYNLKGMLRGKFNRDQSAANKFFDDLKVFKKSDSSMKGLEKFVMSYKQ